MTTGNRHKVRCTCWWLDVSGIDEPAHSTYVRGSSESDCPAHPTVDLEPAAPYRVTGAQASLERVERRHFRWSHFWLAVAAFGLLATCVNIWQQDIAGLWITGPALIGSLWLVQTTA